MGAHQKGARRSGATLALLDETGHSFRARVGTTWAPVAHAPVLKRVERRYRSEVTSQVALTAPLRRKERARLVARHIQGKVNGAEAVRFLKYLRRRLGTPLWLVWDRLAAHRSREVQAFLATCPGDFHLELLPPYAPDLNPEEQCNAVVKKALLNATPDSVEAMRRLARREFRRLQHRSATLRAFFKHAGLSLHWTT